LQRPNEVIFKNTQIQDMQQSITILTKIKGIALKRQCNRDNLTPKIAQDSHTEYTTNPQN